MTLVRRDIAVISSISRELVTRYSNSRYFGGLLGQIGCLEDEHLRGKGAFCWKCWNVLCAFSYASPVLGLFVLALLAVVEAKRAYVGSVSYFFFVTARSLHGAASVSLLCRRRAVGISGNKTE